MAATEAPTDDPPAADVEHVPGEGDIWFFVLFESLLFTAYFCVYLYFRTQDERAFLDATDGWVVDRSFGGGHQRITRASGCTRRGCPGGRSGSGPVPKSSRMITSRSR